MSVYLEAEFRWQLSFRKLFPEVASVMYYNRYYESHCVSWRDVSCVAFDRWDWPGVHACRGTGKLIISGPLSYPDPNYSRSMTNLNQSPPAGESVLLYLTFWMYRLNIWCTYLSFIRKKTMVIPRPFL